MLLTSKGNEIICYLHNWTFQGEQGRYARLGGQQEQTGGFGCVVVMKWNQDEDSASCKHQGRVHVDFLIGLLRCKVKRERGWLETCLGLKYEK